MGAGGKGGIMNYERGRSAARGGSAHAEARRRARRGHLRLGEEGVIGPSLGRGSSRAGCLRSFGVGRLRRIGISMRAGRPRSQLVRAGRSRSFGVGRLRRIGISMRAGCPRSQLVRAGRPRSFDYTNRKCVRNSRRGNLVVSGLLQKASRCQLFFLSDCQAVSVAEEGEDVGIGNPVH